MASNTFLVSLGLTATMIGAGIFSLPYVFVHVGLLRGIVYVDAVAMLMAFTYVLYADVLVQTPGRHNYVTLSKLYLGDFGERLSIVMTIIAMFLVLCVYLILAGRFVLLLGGASDMMSAMIFWAIGSLGVFLSFRKFVRFEFMTSVLIACIVLVLFVWSVITASDSIIVAPASFLWWLPIAPLLFAFSGRAAISELVLYAPRSIIRRVIITGIAGIAILYVLFAISMISLTGGAVSEDTISGLAAYAPPAIIALVGFMGLIALGHVYVLISFDVVNILHHDLQWSLAGARMIVGAAPLLIYFLAPHNFFGFVSLVGGIFFALENIFIGQMWLVSRARHGTALMRGIHPLWAVASIGFFAVVFIYALVITVF